jgi:hypothetical protein
MCQMIDEFSDVNDGEKEFMKMWNIHVQVHQPVGVRVARWFISRPKTVILVNLGGFCNGRCWYIL